MTQAGIVQQKPRRPEGLEAAATFFETMLYPTTIVAPFAAEQVLPAAIVVGAYVVSALGHDLVFWGLSGRRTFLFPIPPGKAGQGRQAQSDQCPLFPAGAGFVVFVLTCTHDVLFTVGEAETLALPGGKLALIKLTRNPRQAYDQQMDIWLAPTLGYLPARIRITEASGDFVDLKWLRSESAQPS